MKNRLKWQPNNLDISILINMYQLICECTLIQLQGVIILIDRKKSGQDAHRQTN